jgi:hypothetical protein
MIRPARMAPCARRFLARSSLMTCHAKSQNHRRSAVRPRTGSTARAGLVGIVSAVLLVLAYFALNAMLARAYRKLHDNANRPDSDADSPPDQPASSTGGHETPAGQGSAC